MLPGISMPGEINPDQGLAVVIRARPPSLINFLQTGGKTLIFYPPAKKC